MACARGILFMEEKLVPFRFCPRDLFGERTTVFAREVVFAKSWEISFARTICARENKERLSPAHEIVLVCFSILRARQTFKDSLWRS
jgi:hypothetical protein